METLTRDVYYYLYETTNYPHRLTLETSTVFGQVDTVLVSKLGKLSNTSCNKKFVKSKIELHKARNLEISLSTVRTLNVQKNKRSESFDFFKIRGMNRNQLIIFVVK